MLTIIADNELTRRKTAHVIVNSEGQPVFSASKISDIMDWLYEDGQTAFNLETVDGATFRILLSTVPSLISGFILEAENADA